MTSALQVVEWFSSRRLGDSRPRSSIVVGGTGLLAAFVESVASFGCGGSLTLAAPYMRATVISTVPELVQLRTSELELTILASSAADARGAIEALGGCPWASLRVGFHSRLHAKLYSFVGPRLQAACLVGSHNLTMRGTQNNIEAGVLFASPDEPEILTVARAVQEQVEELMRIARIEFDSRSFMQFRAG